MVQSCRYEEGHHYRKAIKPADVEGKDILMGGFFQILPLVSSLPHSSIVFEYSSTIPYKDTQVFLTTAEFREIFEESFYDLSDLKQFSVDIWTYFGIAQGKMTGMIPIW